MAYEDTSALYGGYKVPDISSPADLDAFLKRSSGIPGGTTNAQNTPLDAAGLDAALRSKPDSSPSPTPISTSGTPSPDTGTETKPTSVLFQKPSMGPTSTGTITAPPQADLSLSGVSLNAPNTGLPLLSVDNPQVQTGPKAGFLSKMFAGAANAFLGAYSGVANSLTNALNTQIKTSHDTSQEAAVQNAAALAEIPVSAVGAYFAPAAATFAASRSLPVVGKAIGFAQDKVFGALQSAAGYGAEKGINAIPGLSDQSKQIALKPVTEILNNALMAGVFASLGIGEKINEEGISAKYGEGAGIAAGSVKGAIQIGNAILDPVGTTKHFITAPVNEMTTALKNSDFVQPYKKITEDVSRGINTLQKDGQEATPERVQAIVTQSVKDTPIPNDSGELLLPTENGKIAIQTNQKTVLKNLIQGHEELTYQTVPSLGVDQNGKPIEARFAWDFKNKTGTVYVTNKATAADIAAQFGHYVSRNVSDQLDALLEGTPGYGDNPDQTKSMLVRYAMDRLGGNATPDQINAELLKIAQGIHDELPVINAQKQGQTTRQALGDAFGNVINNPEAQKQAPETAQFLQYALGGEGLRAGATPDMRGLPGTPEEQAGTLSALTEAQKVMRKVAINENPDFIQEQINNENKKAALNEKAANFENGFGGWKNILKAIKNSVEFKKEGDITDNTINGTIMQKGDRRVLVPYDQINAYKNRGYFTVGSMDEIAQSNGFDSAEAYVNAVRELDNDTQAINRSPVQKQAHEFLLKNDPNYANLSQRIEDLRRELTGQVETLAGTRTGTNENTPNIPQEQTTTAEQPTVEPRTTQSPGNEPVKQITLDTLNPTGSVFADYSPEQRAKMPLGENITTLDKTSGKDPNEEITVYRGTNAENGSIVPGDFITTNEQLAKDYAGNGRVISAKVRVGDILDDKTEPLGEEYIYRPQTEQVKPLEPLPTNTELPKKTSKLARGVEEKAIANKLANGLGDLPEYQTISVKDQAKQASDLILNDPDRAKRIALGTESPPPGLLPESVFTAVEDAATKAGDVDTLNELATTSSLSGEASLMGQRLRMLAERNPYSAVSVMQDVINGRAKARAKETGGKSIREATNDTITQIKKSIPKPSVDEWSSFLESIKC